MSENDHEVHLADTIVSPSSQVGHAHNADASGPNRADNIGLLRESDQHLTREIDAVLCERLRIASLLLFGGFSAFLLKQLLAGMPWSSPIEVAAFWTHVAVTVITGIVAQRLCAHCKYAVRHLRMIELTVFISSAAFLALITYVRTVSAAEHGYIQSITGPWTLLILTYAMFIPNRWKRGMLVIIPMALTPIVVLLSVRATSRDFLNLLRTDPDFQFMILESMISMILTATVAIWGIRKMTTLRTAAFEAKQFGQYRLRQRIGVGGMGAVYIGEHKLLRRPCAIKLIHPEKAGDPKVLARFEREVQATAQLTHWNTVDIYDFGRADDGTFYYVMEYLPGLCLQDLVDRQGPMPAGRVIHLLTQTCDALSEAHAEGMIHRDIKPANIFAARRGHRHDVAKLLDFGLVRQAESKQDSSLTSEHTLLGSPLYMSPEQAAGDDLDQRSDIYSLGAVAFTLLTGRPPFDGSRPLQVIIAHAQTPPPKLSKIQQGIPADIEAVVLKALEKSPDARFQTAAEFHDALSRCESAGQWGWNQAEQWWASHGCPNKKRLDDAIDQQWNENIEEQGAVG